MAKKDPREPFTRIDVQEAAEMQKNGAAVIDVREPHEFTSGHVPNASPIPVNSVYARREELPRDRDVIFVCAVGQRSALACEMAAARAHPPLQPGRRHGRLDQGRHAGGQITAHVARRPVRHR